LLLAKNTLSLMDIYFRTFGTNNPAGGDR
jgi:hypothetical protein